MADASFNSAIAEHQALQITLRDDLARFGTVLCGESLTTGLAHFSFHCELAKVMTVMTQIDLIVKWILTVKFVARR